jgi:hypothetical protein
VIRLSVSDLETLRYWRANETSTMEDLVARLTRREPPTPQMRAGAALAKLFETFKGGGSVDVERVDGITFDFSGMTGTMPLASLRELKGEKLYETPSGLVTLVGKVDGLEGRTVRDQKLTENWEAEKYLDSLQWRAYLDMFGADAFVYDVFKRSKHNDNDPDMVEVKEYHPMTFYRYPKLADDVRAAVNELARVVAFYVPEKVTAEAAS